MDVERTVESAVDQSFELTMGSELRKSRSGFDSMDTFAGGAVANAMKPMLVRGLASGINGFAAGGNLTFPALGDTPQDHVPRDSILAAFRGIVKTETHDRLALVTVRIGRPGDDSVDVALKLEKGETGWRVVGLDNIAPVLQRLQQRPSTRRRPR